MRTRWQWLVVLVVVSGMLVGALFAQQGGRVRGPMGGRGGRGWAGMSEEQRAQMMARMQERRLSRLKEQLGVSDDEWAVLSEPIKALSAMRTEEFRATQQLRQAVSGEDVTKDELKKALDEYRKTNKDIAGRREKLQAQLKELVTVKQEVVLVLGNIL